MKKVALYILMVLIFTITGCSSLNTAKQVNFNVFYSKVVAFSEDDKLMKSISQDAVLLMDSHDYKQFYNEHFAPREISIIDPDKSKAVLYVQFPPDGASTYTYSVNSIKLVGKDLVVTAKKEGSSNIDAVTGFKGKFYWVMLIEIDSELLTNDMKVSIKR